MIVEAGFRLLYQQAWALPGQAWILTELAWARLILATHPFRLPEHSAIVA